MNIEYLLVSLISYIYVRSIESKKDEMFGIFAVLKNREMWGRLFWGQNSILLKKTNKLIFKTNDESDFLKKVYSNS